jgi:drug/metabolite transporter (DMT)-like permease
MKPALLRDDALLLLTSAIWGFAFVAQRVGMQHLGPFAFNGIRFALGSLSLLPLILIRRRRARAGQTAATGADRGGGVSAFPLREGPRLLKFGLLAGAVLFGGASLQQMGIVHTTAGKAGFITGLYVVLVPLSGLIWGQRAGRGRWMGALLAIAGLYFLSVTGAFSIATGDLLVLISAAFWAAHVQIVGWLSPKVDALKLSAVQFAVCSLLSLSVALVAERFRLDDVFQAAVPILYGGVASVGVAYTLQVVVQKTAHPAHAAILLSLESVFAVLGGRLLLGETLSVRGLAGCALMLAGMVVSQTSTLGNPALTRLERGS